MWDDVLSIRGSGNILRLVGQVFELVAQTVCVVCPSGLDCSGLLSLLLTHREKDKTCSSSESRPFVVLILVSI